MIATDVQVALLPANGLLYRRLDDGQWWPLDLIQTGQPLGGPELDALQMLVPDPEISANGLGYVSCSQCGEVYDVGPGDRIGRPFVSASGHGDGASFRSSG